MFYCLYHIAIYDMASVASNSNNDMQIVHEVECCTCTDYTQCYTEANEVPAAEMVIVTCQFMQCGDKKTEPIIGKQVYLPTDDSNSELVIGHN